MLRFIGWLCHSVIMPPVLTQVRSRARTGSMAEAVAKKIAEMSKDGAELVEYAFRVFRDTQMPFEDRKWAFEWIAKYGAGLPSGKLEVSGNIGVSGAPRMNLTDYTLEELDQFEAIQRAAEERKRLAQATDANPKVIDVVPSSTTP